MPYFLQIAFGWTRLTLYHNILSIVVLLPTLFFLAKFFGINGAALFFPLLNGGYILFIIPRLHRKFLITEKIRWYRQDLLIPTLVGTFAAFCCFYLFKNSTTPLIGLASSYILILLCVSLATPLSCQWLYKRLYSQWLKSPP